MLVLIQYQFQRCYQNYQYLHRSAHLYHSDPSRPQRTCRCGNYDLKGLGYECKPHVKVTLKLIPKISVQHRSHLPLNVGFFSSSKYPLFDMVEKPVGSFSRRTFWWNNFTASVNLCQLCQF